jgi:hypothetical protein
VATTAASRTETRETRIELTPDGTKRRRAAATAHPGEGRSSKCMAATGPTRYACRVRRAGLAVLVTLLACRGERAATLPVTASVAPADRDGDGIADAHDECIDRPEDRDGALDEDGCPEDDADGDFVLDVCDACPQDHETYNYLDDEDGCPDCALRMPADGVYFERGVAALDPDSIESLRRFARSVVADDALAAIDPDAGAGIERIAVVARAAWDEPYPQALSERRADVVVDLLVAEGIGRARVDTVALGAAPEPPDGRDPDRLGRRTYLVVVRERGHDIPLDQGRVIELLPGPFTPAPRPATPGCPANRARR